MLAEHSTFFFYRFNKNILPALDAGERCPTLASRQLLGFRGRILQRRKFVESPTAHRRSLC